MSIEVMIIFYKIVTALMLVLTIIIAIIGIVKKNYYLLAGGIIGILANMLLIIQLFLYW